MANGQSSEVIWLGHTLGVQEHGSGSSANNTIVSFYDAILPMGIDSTERYRLILTCNVSFIDIRIEDTIIHVDVVDLNHFEQAKASKACLPLSVSAAVLPS